MAPERHRRGNQLIGLYATRACSPILLNGGVSGEWYGFRQPETLDPETLDIGRTNKLNNQAKRISLMLEHLN